VEKNSRSVTAHERPASSGAVPQQQLQGQQRRLLPFSFLRGEWKRERMF
jgi:hypothetical protein